MEIFFRETLSLKMRSYFNLLLWKTLVVCLLLAVTGVTSFFCNFLAKENVSIWIDF